MASNVSGLAVVPVDASPPNQQDQTFLQQAQETNLTEIEEAKVALTHGDNVATQAFALWMIGDHTAQAAQLGSIAQQLNVTLPTAPNPQDQAVITQLGSLHGAAFDQTYAQEEVQGHQQTIVNFQAEIAGGQNTAVTGLANAGLPIIQAHEQQAAILAGQGDTGLPAQTTAPAIASNGATPAPSAQDQAFVQMAGSMNQLEIQEGNLAIQQGNTATAEFGRWMVADHTAAGKALTAIAQQDGFSVPTTLTAQQQQELTKLQNAGKNFDSVYATDQVVGHVDTLMAFIKEADQGTDPSLVAFAKSSIPVLASHLAGAADIGLDSIGLQVSLNDIARLTSGLSNAPDILRANPTISGFLDAHPSAGTFLTQLSHIV